MAPRQGQGGYVQTAYHPPSQSDDANQVGVTYVGTTDSSEEVRRRAEQQVDQEIENGSFFDKIIGMFTRDSQVNEAYAAEMNAQARALAQGVQLRQAPAISSAHYMSNPHPALKAMVEEDADPRLSSETGDAWRTLGNEMAGFQQTFVSAITSSEADWRGEAGDSARQFMADVANYIGTAGQSAQLAGTQESVHSEALSSAKNSMPDPIPFDAAAANRELQTTTDPLAYSKLYAEHMATYQASQEAHQQAAEVMSSYDKSLSGASAMPAFGAPPQMTGEGEIDRNKIDETGDPGKGGGDEVGVGPGGGGDRNGTDNFGGGGGGGGGTGGGGGGGIGGGGGGGTGGGDTGGGRTSDQGYTPNQPGGQLPGRGGPLPGGGGGDQNYPGLPFGPMGPTPGGMGDDSTRGGSRFGGGGGQGNGGGPGAGRAGFGPGGSAAGGGMGAKGGFGGGASGVGALAAEQAAARGGGGGLGGGAAGRGGGMGAGGMGGMGGGRSQGGEDDEHQRPSYLVEPDPDTVFGTDQVTAPPVIGG